MELRSWFDKIIELGPLYGYNAEPTKSWLIVKERSIQEAERIFENTGVNITASGKKQLGAALGTVEFKYEFVSKQVEKWVNQITSLSKIANHQPEAAHTAFTTCLRHKYTYFMRTIPEIAELLQPLEAAIRSLLIPALTEGRLVTDDERTLLLLPARLGGMGLTNPTQISDDEFNYSIKATKELATAITIQQIQLPTNLIDNSKLIKTEIRSQRRKMQPVVLEHLRSRMTIEQKRTNEITQESGASNWLTTLPLEEKGYSLSKREFWDAVHLRYLWPLPRLPSKCACGGNFDITHALTCKKGGFICQRHNEIRDITADMLSEVCEDVCVEPT